MPTLGPPGGTRGSDEGTSNHRGRVGTILNFMHFECRSFHVSFFLYVRVGGRSGARIQLDLKLGWIHIWRSLQTMCRHSLPRGGLKHLTCRQSHFRGGLKRLTCRQSLLRGGLKHLTCRQSHFREGLKRFTCRQSHFRGGLKHFTCRQSLLLGGLKRLTVISHISEEA